MLLRPLLAIETSGSSLGVALRTEQGVSFERNVTAGAIHGRALAPLIDECLRGQNLSVADLEAVAVSVGPGSWTGLRIGITAAKTLAWSAGVGLVAVPSFEALALQALAAVGSPTPVVTLRNARSEGFFAAVFSETSGTLERWMSECVIPGDRVIADVEALLAQRASTSAAFCGDGVCMDAIADAAIKRGWIVLREVEHISARILAEAGWR
ncbi:MAG TPA: tRNA (adenosine(37)-N6)-threonylcarbamoyltransferase complex dimerization subunit type 1 TsaB, partial [Planctomycetota bacterium]|nr:tRNA (adenosine(37)-N6)-threonylcarbamoyltransferase complex dimerization subunit type 1 TsaB [Planctomycetota bacterium]